MSESSKTDAEPASQDMTELCFDVIESLIRKGNRGMAMWLFRNYLYAEAHDGDVMTTVVGYLNNYHPDL